MSVPGRVGLTRVVKLGGSLLDWEGWPSSFVGWLEQQPQANNLIVVGGGRVVDHLRQLDDRVGLGQTACHVVAIGLMRVTAAQVASRLGWDVGYAGTSQSGTQIVDVEQTLLDERFCKMAGSVPPVGWQVTSDSLAAWIAVGVSAEELVLLKSRDAAAVSGKLLDWAQDGLVDDHFPQAAGGLAIVRTVNLRAVRTDL